MQRSWFYEFELPGAQRTRCYLPAGVTDIHRTRLEMMTDVLDRRLGPDWSGTTCLDIACHQGWFSSQLARRGVQVLGIDARAEHVADARLITEVCGLHGATRFEQHDVSAIGPGGLGEFDIVLVFGLLYHLENPVQALRLARSHTTNVCLVETQVAPNLSGPIDWGSYEFVNTMVGSFAVVDETGDLENESAEANTTAISLVPSVEALVWLMEQVGFARVEVVTPSADAYEQHRFAKRVVVAGYVEPARRASGPAGIRVDAVSAAPRTRPEVSTGADGSTPSTVDAFTGLWFDQGNAGATWQTITWMGTPIQKHPFDLVIMQEIVWETRPQVIIEAGTNRGGSAQFYASLLDLIGEGEILTTDVLDLPDRPDHPRISYRPWSSTSDDFVGEATRLAARVERTMVVLDSDHRADHVRAELERLAPLVSIGCYLVCEDGCVNGHPVLPDFGPGPLEAIDDFLAVHPEFEVDASRERLLSTFNPRGYLRRVR